ncbi:MAG TPA: VWA domain-containing protein [Steroidobacteraceae bacterium]|nr:VWA domain-containing protein [Steroidobacteraceae bacterium]
MIRANRFLALLIPALTLASVPPDRQDELDEIVVVTGMRASQGGAQDIKFFRGQVELQKIPHPNDFTAEGLMSEHDLVLPAAEPCRQLFCLTGDATRADLIAAREARYLVGVGFTSNIDAKTWRRDPVNLVAVVDKSGSMSGEPLALVRRSLAEVAKQLRPGDQMSIVLYGDTAHVHLAPTPVNRAGDPAILAAIAAIESNGSTSMEAGLRVGYRVADETAPAFKGRTRLMLFTDERPNTDATDAASFMGMAIEHSKQDVGLTTVGVGVQFGAELATKIGSVRGGNLYFIRNTADVDSLFADQLDYMVSELAHDLTVTLTPRPGLKIAGVYGVPGELLGWQDATTVTLTIPTVFLDNHGGGIFFTLAPEAEAGFLPEKSDASPLASVAVDYTPLGKTTREGHGLTVALNPAGPSAGMKLGHLLIDEFTVLHGATSAHYLQNDQETAYQLLSRFHERLGATDIAGLDDERKLVDTLYSQIAFLSGHGAGEAAAIAPAFVKLWGRWKIVGVHGADVDLHSGETLEFTPDNDMLTWAKKAAGAPRDEESYESNDRQIYLPESELVFHYRIKGDTLSLHHRRSGLWVRLVRDDRS